MAVVTSTSLLTLSSQPSVLLHLQHTEEVKGIKDVFSELMSHLVRFATLYTSGHGSFLVSPDTIAFSPVSFPTPWRSQGQRVWLQYIDVINWLASLNTPRQSLCSLKRARYSFFMAFTPVSSPTPWRNQTPWERLHYTDVNNQLESLDTQH